VAIWSAYKVTSVPYCRMFGSRARPFQLQDSWVHTSTQAFGYASEGSAWCRNHFPSAHRLTAGKSKRLFGEYTFPAQILLLIN
jgi:hypothetical protein